MMRNKKVCRIASVSAILLGLLLILYVFISIDFRFDELSTENYVRRTHLFSGEAFEKIEVNTSFFDVKILPVAEGEEPCILLPCSENISHNVSVRDGKLSVAVADGRAWYEKVFFCGISNENTVVEFHLTHAQYAMLQILTGSGDVSVVGGNGETDLISFSLVSVETSSGDISFDVNTQNGAVGLLTSSGDISVSRTQGTSLGITTSSGDILLQDCKLSGMRVRTSSGDVAMQRVNAKTIEVENSSGSVALEGVQARDVEMTTSSGDVQLCETLLSGELHITTSSGEIDIKRSDASILDLETSSGDVEAELLSGKMYSVDTGSGKRQYPDDEGNGGPCYVKSASGDVKITVVP